MGKVLDQSEFFRAMDPGSHFGLVLDHLPGVSFFAKNLAFELVAVNENFWTRLGVSSEAEVLGKNDFELFPEALAATFRTDDERVLTTGEPQLRLVELFFNRQGLPDWFLTHKLPVQDRAGGIIGLMGISRACASPGKQPSLHPALDVALGVIREEFRQPLRVEDLAQRSGVSLRQFNRLFREILGMGPQTFIIKTRVQAACECLRSSGKPIGEVALEVGFCDQSALTQHFRKHMGVTPMGYRKRNG